MHESIEDILASLTLKSSYWSMVISKFNKKEIKEKTFIMGIDFDNDNIKFLYNFDNLKNLDIKLIDKILEHEVGHIFNNHYIRAIQLQIDKKNYLLGAWNTATDMALNCNINGMPRSFWCGWNFNPIFPDYENFEDGLMSEEYFEKIIDKYNLNKLQHINDEEDKSENENNNNDSEDKRNSNENFDDTSEENSENNETNEFKENENSDKNFENQIYDVNNESKKNSPESEKSEVSDEQCNNCKQESDTNDENDISCNECDSNYSNTRIAQNDHEHWKGNKNVLSDPNSTYVAETLFREVIEQATEEYTQSFGSLPGNLQHTIDDFLAPPKLPYYELIKKLVIGSRLGKQKVSYSKLNRKRMYIFAEENEVEDMIFHSPFPGKSKDISFNIGVLLDTSASIPITNDGIYEALNGIESILKNDKSSKVILLQIDTAIREEIELKSIKDIHRIVVKGRGGTRLLPGLNRLKELKVDVAIVFTDGYIEDISQFIYSLPKKIIWVLPEKYSSTLQIENIGHIIKFPITN